MPSKTFELRLSAVDIDQIEMALEIAMKRSLDYGSPEAAEQYKSTLDTIRRSLTHPTEDVDSERITP